MASRRSTLLLSVICLAHLSAADLPAACTDTCKPADANACTLSCSFDLTDLSFLASLQPTGHQYNTLAFSLNDDLKEIKRGTFANPIFDKVSTFTLDFNEISTIESDAFKGLKNLKKLLLNNNNITSLKGKMLNGLESLNYLSFSRNEISAIDGASFRGLSELKSLDLANNKLTTINKEIFNSMPSLMFLHLHGNRITAIERHNFPGVPLLFSLDLHNNLISELHPESFQGLDSLFDLKLGANSVGRFDSHLFETTPDLRRLDLSQTKFTTLPHLSSTTVHILNLAHCSLDRLPVDFFSSLVNVEVVDLSNNSLSSLPAGLFRGLTHLTSLNLDSNSLTSVGVATMEELYLLENGNTKVMNLTATNNAWNCQLPSMKEVFAWCKQKTIAVKFPCSTSTRG